MSLDLGPTEVDRRNHLQVIVRFKVRLLTRRRTDGTLTGPLFAVALERELMPPRVELDRDRQYACLDIGPLHAAVWGR